MMLKRKRISKKDSSQKQFQKSLQKPSQNPSKRKKKQNQKQKQLTPTFDKSHYGMVDFSRQQQSGTPLKSVSYQSSQTYKQKTSSYGPGFYHRVYHNKIKGFPFDWTNFVDFVLYHFMEKYKSRNVAMYVPQNEKQRKDMVISYTHSRNLILMPGEGWDPHSRSQLWDFLEESKQKNVKLAFILLYFYEQGKQIGHANMLVFDLEKKVLLRFEPHGVSYGDFIVDDGINTFLKSLISQEPNLYQSGHTGHKYIAHYVAPNNICPIDIILQGKENMFSHGELDFLKTKGLCIIWSLWFADLMLKNPNAKPSKILKYMGGYMEQKNEKPYKTIRYYLNHLMQAFLKKKEISKTKQLFYFGYDKLIKSLTPEALGKTLLIGGMTLTYLITNYNIV